jgi:hypothetical protein
MPYPGEKSDFARVDMQVTKLSSRLENFKISFDKNNGRAMYLDWETTHTSVNSREEVEVVAAGLGSSLRQGVPMRKGLTAPCEFICHHRWIRASMAV